METLVIGGTGTVGTEVTRALLAINEGVRVLSRSAERAASVPDGARGFVGDLRHPAGLGRAFQDVDAVFLCVAMSPDETEQGLAAVQAARDAAVHRIVYLSVHRLESGLHIPHFASKLPVERAIRQSGMEHSVLRPNNFFQTDLWYQEAIARHGVYPQPSGGVGLNRVDVRDIADAAVNALTGDGHDGAVYPLVGPDVLTGERTARIWSEHLGREVRYAGDDLDAWAAQARLSMPEWMVHDACVMWEHIQKRGLVASDADFAAQEKVLTHPPRPFSAFAAEVAGVWRVRSAAN